MAENFDFQGDSATTTPLPARDAPIMPEPTALPITPQPVQPAEGKQPGVPQQPDVGPTITGQVPTEDEYLARIAQDTQVPKGKGDDSLNVIREKQRNDAMLMSINEVFTNQLPRKLPEALVSGEDTSPSILEGLESGFALAASGELFRGAEELVDAGSKYNVPDVAFMRDKKQWAKDTGYSRDIALAMEGAKLGDPAARELLQSLSEAMNPVQADNLVQAYRRMKEDQRIQSESSWWAFGPGLAGGIVIDVVTMVAITKGLGAMGAISRSLHTYESIMAARKGAAATIASWGALEGALITGIPDVTGSRTGITMQEYMIAMGLGALLGGTLGAAAPRLLGGVLVKGDALRAAELLKNRKAAFAEQQRVRDRDRRKQELEAESGGDGGAALNVERALPQDRPAPGFASTAGEMLSKVTRGAATPFRSPKSIYRDLVMAGSIATKNGLRGVDRVSAIVGQVYRTDMTTAGDLAGVPRATGALTDADAVLTNNVTAVMKQTRENYEEFTSSLYGQGWAKRVANNEGRTVGYGMVVNEDTAAPTALQFNTWADMITQARGEAKRDLERVATAADADKVSGKAPRNLTPEPKVQAAVGEIEEAIRAKVGQDRFDDTMGFIDRAGQLDDTYYASMAELEISAKMLPRAAVNSDYRPQMAVPEEILADRAGWDALMLRQWKGEKPDAEWINNRYSQLTDDELPEGPLLREDETFDDLTERNPELAAAISEVFEAARRELVEDGLREVEKTIEQELTRFNNKTYRQVMDEYNETSAQLADDWNTAQLDADTAKAKQVAAAGDDDALADATEIHNKALNRLSVASNGVVKHEELHEELLNAARVLDDAEAMPASGSKPGFRSVLDEREAAQAEADRFTAVLIKHAKVVRRRTGGESHGAQPKKANKEAAVDIRKVQRKIEKEAAKKTIKQSIARMTNGILDGGGSAVPVALTPGVNKHMKRRAINLAGLRHEPNVAKFFRQDAELTRELYTYSAGRDANLQLTFGRFLDDMNKPAQEGKSHVDIVGKIREVIDEGFTTDANTIRNRNGPDVEKELADLTEARNKWTAYYQQVMGEYTRSTQLKNANEGLDRAAALAQTITTQAVLGNIALSFVADIGMVLFAGGRLGVGLKGFLGGRGVRKAIEDMAGDDGQFEMAVIGPNAWSSATASNMYDLDSPTVKMGKQRTMAGKLQAGAQTTAVAQGWMNMMHPWNKWVRKVAGLGNAEYILKTALKGQPLEGDDIAHFAKLGLDDEVLAAMAELTRKFPVKSGSWELTDITKWADASVTYHGKTVSGAALVGKFKKAIRVASDEALLDPGLGDRPFMRANVIGRLFLTLSSFMYKAGQTYVSPLIQQGIINPRDAKVYISGFASLLIPIIMNEVRDRKSGKEGRLDKLDDPGVLAEVLKDGFMRSPAAVGMSGTTLDILTNLGGDEVNSLVQAMTGTDRNVVNTQWTRSTGNLASVLGPVVGTAGSMVDTVANLSTKSPNQAVLDVARFTPGFNTLFINLALNKLLGDN